MKAAEKVRTFFLALTIALLALPAQAQTSGDTIIVKNGGAAKNNPGYFGDEVFKVSKWDTLKVIEQKEEYLKITKLGKEGWISRRSIFTKEELQEARREKAAARRKKKKRRQYLEEMRSKGYTIVLVRQTFRKNSADGISVGLGLANISRSKTVKYGRITWKLFNSVGDPTTGKNTASATAQTRLVGPVEPEGTGFTEFENVWYSSVGTCAEIRKIEVEHIDGSSFTYVSDLKDIAQLSKSVRLEGDCSYEAQQERK